MDSLPIFKDWSEFQSCLSKIPIFFQSRIVQDPSSGRPKPVQEGHPKPVQEGQAAVVPYHGQNRPNLTQDDTDEDEDEDEDEPVVSSHNHPNLTQDDNNEDEDVPVVSSQNHSRPPRQEVQIVVHHADVHVGHQGSKKSNPVTNQVTSYVQGDSRCRTLLPIPAYLAEDVQHLPIAKTMMFSSNAIMSHLARQQHLVAQQNDIVNSNQNIMQKFNEGQNDLLKHLFNGK
jgi:hypothetical protein